MFDMDGFLGTGASLGSDLSIIIQIILYIALCIGVVAQRLKKYKLHDWIQTPVVVLNMFFIIFVMVASFNRQQVLQTLPDRPADPFYLSAAVHGSLGLIAQTLAIYSLLAGHKILPRRIGRLRYVMWATFFFWSLAFLVGLGTYYTWYIRDTGTATDTAGLETDTGPAADSGEAVAVDARQRILLQNFDFAPQDLTLVAGTEVTWVNQDGAPHNVTFVSGEVESENFFQGESFAHTFTEPGDFEMYCTLHGNPGTGMYSKVTVLPASAENVAQVAEIQAAQPTPNPVPPPPTPAPAVPPPSMALIEPPTAEATIVGIVSYHDVLAHSDQVQVSLSGLSTPPAGSEYQAWLVNYTTGNRLSLGIVPVDGDGRAAIQYDDPDQQNLLALYDGFEITTEPEFDDDPTPGIAVYSGRQPAQATAFILNITVSAADTPGNPGYALGGRIQTEELHRHVTELASSFEFLSIGDARRHAEHIVNLLEGNQGEFGGDLDGLHGVQNPGDGFGIIPYAQAMYIAADEAAQAPDATEAIRIHGEHVKLSAGNAQEWSVRLREAALAVLAAESVGDIGEQVETLTTVSNFLLNGNDLNGDGNIAPEEGGFFTAYQHGQYMAAIGVSDDPAGIAAAPRPTPEPTSTSSEIIELVMNMLDFRFEQPSLTIPAGAMIRFINIGAAPHSATADDGTFDTTLLDSGGEATITFAEPGTYAYYCLLHGQPGGVGMAGEIIVEE